MHDTGRGLADGEEWKTPALWGIGYTKVVNDHAFFLHDGRARNLTEAILWHGGEAELAKEFFRNLSSSKRKAMIKLLESL